MPVSQFKKDVIMFYVYMYLLRCMVYCYTKVNAFHDDVKGNGILFRI